MNRTIGEGFATRSFTSLTGVISAIALVTLSLGGCDCDDDNTTRPTLLPPSVVFTTPIDGASFTAADDAASDQDGFQLDATVDVQDVAEGNTLVVTVATDEEFSDVVGTPLTQDLSEDASIDIQVTLVEGTNYLRAEITGASGEPLTEDIISVDLTLDVDQPSVSITSPQDGAVLTADDNELTPPAFGINVAAMTTNVAAGASLNLSVNGAAPVTADTNASFVAMFSGVSLNPGANTLRVEVQVEGTTLFDEITVTAPTDGACSDIAISNSLSGTCDFTTADADADPDTAGFQTTIDVTTNCPEAVVVVGDVEYDVTLSGGSGSVEVTLEEGDNDVSAVGRAAGDETSTQIFTVQVDTVAPDVTLIDPDEGAILDYRSDADPASPGTIQYQVVVMSSGHDGDVTVTIGGTQLTANPDNGSFVADANFATEGAVTVTANSTDACGNVGADSHDITVSFVQPSLTITDPAAPSSYGPNDDDDLDPTNGAQLTWTVELQDFPGPVDVVIQCTQDGGTVPFERGRAEDVENGSVTIDVSLPDDRSYECYAEVGNIQSVPVSADVDLTPPDIMITSPQNGFRTSASTVSVGAIATDADGLDVDLFVNNDPRGTEPVSTGSVFFSNVALSEGDNALLVRLVHTGGAWDQVDVIRDSIAPSITDISPTTVTASDDCGTTLDGLQFDIAVEVTDADDDVEVCVSPSSGGQECATTASGVATIACLPVIPGNVTLTVTAVDRAGNATSNIQNLFVDVDVPTVVIAAPADGSATSSTTTDVTVQTDLPVGTTVELYVNGAGVPTTTGTTAADGSVTFNGVALIPNQDNTLRAEGTDATGTGVSPTVTVTVITDPPNVTLVTPPEGYVYSLADVDLDGVPGLQTNAVVSAPGTQAGQPVTIHVDCGAGNTTFNGVTDSSGASTVEITLVDGTCTIDAEVENVVNLVGSDSATVTVDRTPPNGGFSNVVDQQVFDISFDEQLGTPGIQVDIRVSFSGIEPGNTITLTGSGGDPNEGHIVSAGENLYTFDAVTLPDGQYDLCLGLEDDAGNTRSICVEIQVDSSPLVVNIVDPLNNATLNVADDKDLGATPALQYDVGVSRGLLAGNDPVTIRLCGDFVPGGMGVDCGNGFRSIQTVTDSGGFITFADVEFPAGEDQHRIVAQVVLPNQVVASEVHQVTVDTEPPTLELFVANWDTLAPTGTGNAAENFGAGPNFRGEWIIHIDGIGSDNIQLYTDNPAPNTLLANRVTDSAGQVMFTNNGMNGLVQGMHNLTVAAVDVNGNDIDMQMQPQTFFIDTIAPTVSFDNPADGATLTGAHDENPGMADLQYTITATTSPSEFGQTASLFRVVGVLDPPTGGDDVLLGTGTVDAAGSIDFGTLTYGDGSYSLAIKLNDSANNFGSATVSVTVDGNVPEVDIDTPSGDVSIDENDEVDGARAGYQYDIVVSSSSDIGANVVVRDQATGTVLSDPATIGAGGTATVRLTLSAGMTTIFAEITDAVGNVGMSTPITIDLTLPGCGITFTSPTDNPLNVTTDNDGDPGNGVDLDFAAIVGDLGCAGEDADLLVGGVVVDTATVAGDGSVAWTGVNFANPSSSSVFARVFDSGTNETTTATITVNVDLVPPTVTITSPSADPAMLAQVDDESGGAGLQLTMEVQTTDATGGTLEVTSDLDGTLLTGFAVAGATTTLPQLTFSEGVHTVTVTVTDIAESQASDSATFDIDVTPPGPLSVTATLNNRRSGNTTLDWLAPGDDGAGGGSVTSYEVRRSESAIADESDWMAATVVGNPPVNAGPGAAESFDIASLPWAPSSGNAQTWRIATRATDSHGNISAIEPTENVTLEMLSFTFQPAAAGNNFGINATVVGDINGDGFDDVICGHDVADEFWIVYGSDLIPDTDPVAQLVTVTPSSPAGADVRTFTRIGDVNGDGADDFAVGAGLAGVYAGGNLVGSVWVYFGDDLQGMIDASSPVYIKPEQALGDFVLFGIAMGGGANVVGPDMNDDIDDLLIGAYDFAGGPGRVFAVAGRTSWPAGIDLSYDPAASAANDIQQYAGPASPAGGWGAQVRVLDDYDSDGWANFAVYDDITTNDNGRVDLLDGQVISAIEVVAGAGTQLTTVGSGEDFGNSLGAGDLDGDGTRDLIVTSGNSDRISTYFLDGSGATLNESFTDGATAGLYAFAMSTPDVNDDGANDLVAPVFGNDFFDVYFNDGAGNFGPSPFNPNLSFSGAAGFGNWSSGGDFNDDGLDDIIIEDASGSGNVVIYY